MSCKSNFFYSFSFVFIYFTCLILNLILWPSNFISKELIKQFNLYYNSSPIMNINSNDCNDKSNNILGYFGGIPQGRTYSKQPRDYCPSNPLNYIVGKCKVNPWFNYDICYTTGNGDNDITIYYDRKKCITINEIKFKYYDYFKGIRLCSITQNKFNYYILLKNSTKTIDECIKQKNMKVCGILDDLNQIACLHEDYSCPINDIIFNENEIYSINLNNTIIEYENIKINNNLYIHYTNKNFNKKIISNFNFSFDKPCSHFYSEPRRSNFFIAFDFVYCNENINSLYEKIYSENASSFMKDNDLYSSFEQFNLSKFNNYNINLYSSFYFGFDKECILQYNLNESSFINYFSKILIFKRIYGIFTIFYFILCIIIIINSSILNEFSFLFLFLHGIPFLLCVIFLIISIIVIKNVYSPFDCRNENIPFLVNYRKLKKNSKITFIINIIILFIYFSFIIFEIYLAIVTYKRDKIYKKKNLEKKKEVIKRKIRNENTDSELRINVD